VSEAGGRLVNLFIPKGREVGKDNWQIRDVNYTL